MLTRGFRLRTLLVAVIVLTAFGCGSKPSTLKTQGLTIRVFHPSHLPSKGGGYTDASGTTTYYESWGEGRAGRRVEYQVQGMRLRVDGRDYGALREGDVIEISDGEVTVNGRERASAPVPGAGKE